MACPTISLSERRLAFGVIVASFAVPARVLADCRVRCHQAFLELASPKNRSLSKLLCLQCPRHIRFPIF